MSPLPEEKVAALAGALTNGRCPCGDDFGLHHVDTGCHGMDGNFSACYCPLNMPESEAEALAPLVAGWLAEAGCEFQRTGDGTHGPLIRQAQAEERDRIAAAIEAKYLGPDFGRTYDGRESPDAAMRDAYDEGLAIAARIARGDA